MVEPSDYAQYLSEAAASENSILHEFRILYFSDASSFHAFFEGEDDPSYFMPSLRSRISQIIHPYLCRGKPKLRSLRDDVYRLVASRERIMFFADRDYDDMLGIQLSRDQNTYLTDFYSIESNVACVQAIEVALSDFSGLTRADREFGDIIEKYKVARKSFENIMAPVTSWIIAAKAMSKKPNISNIDISKVVEFDLKGVCQRKRGGFDEIKKACGLRGTIVPFKEICRWRKRLCDHDSRLWVRGKFALWFFRSFLLSYMKMLHNRLKEKPKWKIPKPLQTGLIFEALAPRLPTPESLDAFVRKFASA